MYYNAQGTQKDLQKAFMWMQKAGEQDHAPAEAMLGIIKATALNAT
jgi:TPR repeat protein